MSREIVQGYNYSRDSDCFFLVFLLFCLLRSSSVGIGVMRATPGEEVQGSFSAVAAHNLLVGSVPV